MVTEFKGSVTEEPTLTVWATFFLVTFPVEACGLEQGDAACGAIIAGERVVKAPPDGEGEIFSRLA